MRLVVDAQALQSKGSRHRGIGRYSLALLQQMALQAGEHEIILLLNGLYADTVEPIRESFRGTIPAENIRIWRPPSLCGQLESPDPGRRQAGELIREAVIASLKPDAVLLMSLFEGLDEGVITSVGRHKAGFPVAVILYDLIPYIYNHKYLENKSVESWYENKLDDLRRADMLLSISECTKRDAIKYIKIEEDRITNISGAAFSEFQKLNLKSSDIFSLNMRIGINRPFIMYTGGSDHRKNLDGLLHAFADLPKFIRDSHQLVIVCFLDSSYYSSLLDIIKERKLGENDVILAGRVSDQDLIQLYITCKLFVFPSIYEGFGLPALEAMQCGAPVIASATSSLPEIIGHEEAMFDPNSRTAITAAMQRVLENEDFRLRLAAQGLERAQEFSWAKSAKVAWGALNRLVAQKPKAPAIAVSAHRPRLAYVSPLPPIRSGIAGYSADILPELSRFYDIDLVVDQDSVVDPWMLGNGRIRSPDWLRQHHHQIDRVLYQFGNSTFHLYMFDLLRDVPGTVVLHDFGFGGLRGHLERTGEQPEVWSEALEHSHGWQALHDRFHGNDLDNLSMRMPVNLDVIQQSAGVIVHSQYARELAREWFGDAIANGFAIVPFPCRIHNMPNYAQARSSLGWRQDEVVICCFGFVAEPKLNHILLEAWLTSTALQETPSRLIFVGEAKYDYGIAFLGKISESGFSHRISVTGWTDDASYRDHLAGADFAVQLRGNSRGESSAAVFECLTAGLPVVLNAQGSFSEIPAEDVIQLPEAVSVAALRGAMERLAREPAERRRLGEAGRRLVAAGHSPAVTAMAYRDAMERFHDQSEHGAGGVLAALKRLPDFLGSPEERDDLAGAIAVSFPVAVPRRRIWLDVATLESLPFTEQLDLLSRLMLDAPKGWKLEPIEQCSHSGWRRSGRLIEQALKLPAVVALVPEPNERDLVIVGPKTSHELLQQLCECGAQTAKWRGPNEPLPYTS
jgi:glycosyltransferase involved in cell wall biosynthesis